MEEMMMNNSENIARQYLQATNSHDIELFFQNPNDFDDKQQVYSTLYLLRRDILTSFGMNPNDNSKIEYKVIFPGTMAIMAGIDLISKFYCTDNESSWKSVGPRFRKFVTKYIDSQHQEILYQLRNSLLHSFGLYSKDKEYKFYLNENNRSLVQKLDEKNYSISVKVLRERFESAIQEYRKDLSRDQELNRNFKLMFPKYGTMRIE